MCYLKCQKKFRIFEVFDFIMLRMYIKRFFEWICLKERLHGKLSKAPYVNEGEIWWASIGENVGSEINGKSKLFSRPVIIFRKLAHGFYFVIPTTTQNRSGNWYVVFIQGGEARAACLHQARSIDYRRLYSKLGELDPLDFSDIKKGFGKLYLQNVPLLGRRGRGTFPNVT